MEQRPDIRRFALVCLQLGLVMFAVHRYRLIEDFGFQRIVPLIVGGFVAHALLPMKYRRPFFLLLSFAAIGIVLPFPFSAFLVVIGLGLVAMCHLPIPFKARVTLIVLAGCAMAALRNGWEAYPRATELATLVLPAIGAMFMFRLAIYLYDLRHEKVPASISERLSYFFLLPNVCFLLFPVIDYRTFRRTYYDKNQYDIYETGVLWILRGLVHLLLYRLIYGIYSPSPESVFDFDDVIEFMLTTYLLYLRISGQFHLIVGILCLFGFNLPETHKLFYLASGFNDFWRRINIYWKDFMMKMVYYPTFVRTNKFGMLPGMIIATLAVFFGTWILHSYQWFWLRGSFPITGTDTVFWGVLAILVVANSIVETKSGRKRALSQVGSSMNAAFKRSFKTVAMFSTMCVLWSLWNSASLEEWVAAVSNIRTATLNEVLQLLLVLGAAVLLGTIFQLVNSRRRQRDIAGAEHLPVSPVAYTLVVSTLIAALSFPQVTSLLPERAAEIVAVAQEDRLNVHDRRLVERGYYEDLLDNPKFTSTLSIVRSRQSRPDNREWAETRESDIIRKTGDLWEYELIPSFVGTYRDAPFSTNQWGMRDREYPLEKHAGVYRIAIIGASMAMSAGVEQHHVFEALVEDRLNREFAPRGTRFELLNFSVAGYGMVQKLMLADQKAGPFEPDMILIPVYNTEDVRTSRHLANVVHAGIPIPYQGLRNIVERSGAAADMTLPQIRLRLAPYIDEVIEWSMQELTRLCRERGYRLVPVFFPSIDELLRGVDEDRHARLVEAMSASDFNTLSLDGVYDGHDLDKVQIAPWDTHLSAYGNQVVAEGLYELLTPIL